MHVIYRLRKFNIKEGELNKKSVCRNFRQTVTDIKFYNIQFYNLDVIISVG